MDLVLRKVLYDESIIDNQPYLVYVGGWCTGTAWQGYIYLTEKIFFKREELGVIYHLPFSPA